MNKIGGMINMNKTVQLYKIYKKNSFPDINDNIEKFYNEVKQIGLKIEVGKNVPIIEEIIWIKKSVVEKLPFEYKGEGYWKFVEDKYIKKENKPGIMKKREVARLYFRYNSYFNIIDSPKFEFVDSNVWYVQIDEGDGSPVELQEIDGYYITKHGIYTDVDFDYYMDFVITDGALFISAKLQNNLLIDDIRQAMFNKDTKRIETLVQEGKDINEKDERGRTSLMNAAQRLDYEIIKVLLQLGADKSITDNDGKTALDYLNNMGKYVSEKKRPMFEEVKQLLSQ